MNADLNADGSVRVSWTTAAEIDNAGFMVYRSDSADSIGTAVTSNMIASAAAAGSGASYSYVDTVAGDGTAYYWVEAIETNGTSDFHGPVSTNNEAPTSASLTGLADGGGIALLPFALAGMLVALIIGGVFVSRRRAV